MADFVYPTSAALKEIEQVKLPTLVQADPIFSILPIVEEDSHILMWEQEDNWTGLQQLRGLGGAPGEVQKVGSSRYLVTPGVYGERTTLDETELTIGRTPGTFNQPINISRLVMRDQDRLLARRLDRLKYIGWQLVTTGAYNVSGPNGIVHADSYTLQTLAGSDWSNPATATPLADFRAMQLKSRGKSVSFGADAKAYMNRVTLNRMLSNTNTNDLAGKRTSGLATVMSLADINTILAGEGLPQIVVHDDGYLNDAGTFVPWIADGVVTVVGRRTNGAAIGDYCMTRNANNPNAAPGTYTKVDDDPRRVPRTIYVHDGHNGGPRLYFPSAIVNMSVDGS